MFIVSDMEKDRLINRTTVIERHNKLLCNNCKKVIDIGITIQIWYRGIMKGCYTSLTNIKMWCNCDPLATYTDISETKIKYFYPEYRKSN